MLARIITAYVAVQSQASPDLGKDSSSGETSPGEQTAAADPGQWAAATLARMLAAEAADSA